MVSSSQNAAIDAWVLDRQFWGSGINPLSSAETLSSALVQQGLARLGRMTALRNGRGYGSLNCGAPTLFC